MPAKRHAEYPSREQKPIENRQNPDINFTFYFLGVYGEPIIIQGSFNHPAYLPDIRSDPIKLEGTLPDPLFNTGYEPFLFPGPISSIELSLLLAFVAPLGARFRGRATAYSGPGMVTESC